MAYFGRPADAAGLLTFGKDSVTEASVIASFSASAESQQFFGSMDTFQQINTIYKNLFNREAEPAGLTHWAGKINSGEVTLASAAMEILKNAQNSDKTAVANKLAASAAFTAAIDTTAEIIGYSGAAAIAPARAFLAAVTSDAASLTAATADAALAASVTAVVTAGANGPAGQALTLTTGADHIMGTAGNDTISARVVQNVNGEQTNQLATGDMINGGAGVDTLSAKIQTATRLDGSFIEGASMSPETVGVEKVNFTALNSGVNNVGAGPAVIMPVEVNAKFMNGVNHIGSIHSDVSLLVSNVNTLKDDGVYANKRNTEALTVRMDHTAGDAVDNDGLATEADLTVLIDNDYLLRGDASTSGALTVALSPQLEVDKGYLAATPLKFNPYNELTFKVDGVSKTIKIGTGETNAAVVTTYADLKAAIEAGLKAAGLTDVVVTQNVGAYNYFSRDGVARKADTFTLSKDGAVLTSQGAGGWGATAGLPDDNSFGATVIPNDAVKTTAQITVNVELEKVGRGSEGGDLTIGGMATNGKNEWNQSARALEEGVEKFNIKVSGDESQFSSLASLQSTNNTLQTVVVSSATGSKADLIIGNHNTISETTVITDALKDVRDFDSTAFANNVTLNASITDESVAKYMKLKDASTDAPAKDNANFAYNFGAGKDSLNMVISQKNLAVEGSTVREDFSLAINTGAGDDNVTVQIGDGEEKSDISAWFTNSNLNRNLSITTGTGDDTVSAKGAGTWNISTGEGADTVYSDNSGEKATWVLNTADQTAAAATPAARTLVDLISDGNDSKLKLFKATVTVDYQGFTAASVTIDSTSNFSSDLQINQAIKKAINSDAVLSKLLLATDGPANTLVVTSLVDGVQVDTDALLGDLKITVAAPKTGVLTANDIGTLATAYSAATADEAGVLAAYAADVADVNKDYLPKFANAAAGALADITGKVGFNATANVIMGGLGNDVIVTGTGTVDGTAAGVAISKDVVAYTGFLNGVDTIVNFDDADKADLVSFAGYGLKGWQVDGTANDATSGVVAVGDKYVKLVESTTNDGEYLATVYTENGATDTEVGVIGTLDFGVEQEFLSFLIS